MFKGPLPEDEEYHPYQNRDKEWREKENKKKEELKEKVMELNKKGSKDTLALKALYPIVFAPGLGSSCELEIEKGTIGELLKALEIDGYQNSKIYCIPYNTSIHGNIKKILPDIEKFMDEMFEPWGLKDGFVGLGLSQGGIFMRYVLQHSSAGSYMRRLVTVGTPNLGVSKFPYYTPESFIYSKKVMNNVVPANYINLIGSASKHKVFLEHSLLAQLNNESTTMDAVLKAKYKNRIEALEYFLAIGFAEDEYVKPRAS